MLGFRQRVSMLSYNSRSGHARNKKAKSQSCNRSIKNKAGIVVLLVICVNVIVLTGITNIQKAANTIKQELFWSFPSNTTNSRIIASVLVLLVVVLILVVGGDGADDTVIVAHFGGPIIFRALRAVRHFIALPLLPRCQSHLAVQRVLFLSVFAP